MTGVASGSARTSNPARPASFAQALCTALILLGGVTHGVTYPPSPLCRTIAAWLFLAARARGARGARVALAARARARFRSGLGWAGFDQIRAVLKNYLVWHPSEKTALLADPGVKTKKVVEQYATASRAELVEVTKRRSSSVDGASHSDCLV